MFAPNASAQTDTTAVTIPGSPLSVYVGPRGECQSSYLVNGEVAGNFYFGGNQVGDCGFFLAFPKAGAGQPAPLQGNTFGFQDTLTPLFRGLGLDVCDVRGPLLAYGDKKALFIPDKHFSKQGNQLLLAEILRHLREIGADPETLDRGTAAP